MSGCFPGDQESNGRSRGQELPHWRSSHALRMACVVVATRGVKQMKNKAAVTSVRIRMNLKVSSLKAHVIYFYIYMFVNRVVETFVEGLLLLCE